MHVLWRTIKQNVEPLESVCMRVCRGNMVLFYILGTQERPSHKSGGHIRRDVKEVKEQVFRRSGKNNSR